MTKLFQSLSNPDKTDAILKVSSFVRGTLLELLKTFKSFS
jgi:hypothetical protein